MTKQVLQQAQQALEAFDERYTEYEKAAIAEEMDALREALREALAQQVEQQPPFGSKRKAAMAVYTPPFKYLHGYIYDSQNLTVADDGTMEFGVEGAVASRVRGWGRFGYMPNGAELQDEIGQMMADALNALYAGAAPAAQPQVQARLGMKDGLSMALAVIELYGMNGDVTYREVEKLRDGIEAAPAAQSTQEQVYETIIEWDEGGGKRSRRELVRRIAALYAAAPAAQPTCKQDLQVETEQERYVRMCPDIECGRKKQCTRMIGVSCMSRADIAPAAQGCDYCNHPLFAGLKCKNCGREFAPASQPRGEDEGGAG